MAPIRSQVWKYFSKESATEVKCRVCNKVLKCSNNTTNMMQHLKLKHVKYAEILKTKLDRINKEKNSTNGEYTRKQMPSARSAALLDTSQTSSLLNDQVSASYGRHCDNISVNIPLKEEHIMDPLEDNNLPIEENENIPNLTSWLQNAQNQDHITADNHNDLMHAKIAFYKNNEIRAQEKHEADMREMALKLQILQAELKIKEFTIKNFHKNKMQI